MDILSRILSVRDVSWVCYAYMWFYDLRKAKHWISLCSLVQRPNWDQRVNHPELRQTTLLVRWVWIYLCFEIDQWLEVLWCSMEHNFQCFSKHLAAAVEMSSIQYEVFSNHGVPPTRVFFWVCHTLGVQQWKTQGLSMDVITSPKDSVLAYCGITNCV